ncbi:BREX-1 system adenine-specific DNA-methyltransferase PglX [Comamonas resistens]|uniref:BREX-1 system adenine-specific DNA-methyltransferase PglX n=1 Tax=Comamonas resistens TaxID=3046670 RepID=UPI0039BD1B4A
MRENQNNSREQGMEKYFFRASAVDFKKVPGSPISYWISKSFRDCFSMGKPLSYLAAPRKGMVTADNPRFIRFWAEVDRSKIGFDLESREAAKNKNRKWFPYMKGGTFRRWSGNSEYVVNWENDGFELLHMQEEGYKVGSTNHNLEFIFKPAITWTKITSSDSGFRSNGFGYLYDDASGLCPTHAEDDHYAVLGLLNSPVTMHVLRSLNPTLNLNPGNLADIPVISIRTSNAAVRCENFSKSDWSNYEISWEFSCLPLLHPDHRQPTLQASYQSLRTHWRDMTLEMQRLEEENNRIFIDAYGLQDELTPEVPLREITLTCNPHYRYGGDKTEEELEALLLADTMRELVSYAVGCMLGRYSLDKPGLILANQGETLADYLAQVPQPSFAADDDNVIPMMNAYGDSRDDDWFADDITLRFRQFLRLAFGEAHYEDNLAFIEQALNIKNKRNYSLRDYFLGEFYADHVRRYKKRPIYWLFSSPKGSFNALVYMHRYRPDTVSVVLKYLRDYREKLSTERERQLAASINPATSQGDKTRAIKEADRLAKVLTELDDYERDTLYPLATEQLQIDLDDGVKVNYLKFGAALKKIVGLDAKGED